MKIGIVQTRPVQGDVAANIRDRVLVRLADITANNQIRVLMSNCVGQSDGFMSTGNSAAWDRSGRLFNQLDKTETGILIADI